MKKAIIRGVLLAVLMQSVLLLSGCGGEGDLPADTTPVPETTPAVEITTPTNTTEAVTTPADTTAAVTTPADTQISQPEDGKMNIEYVLGTISGAKGTDSNNAGRFKTPDFLTLADVEAVSIGSGYYLTWFAYDASYNYLGNGSNVYPTLPEAGVWLAAGQDVTRDDILKWNPDAVYLRFAVKKTSGNMELAVDVPLSKITVYTENYPGDQDFAKPGLDKVANIASGRQDGAVCGGYLFSFNSSGVCKVYSTENFKLISEFTLDKNTLITPHCNAVCFGSYKYAEDDEFPLLYSNVYNTYKDNRDYDGVCCVYRIQRNGTSFTSTLVQIIKVGFASDTQKWCSPGGDTRPYGNFVVDTDNDRLYAFTMRDADKTTRFFAFPLPLPTAGTPDAATGALRVTLTADDLVDSFTTEYFRYVQGATYYGGKIYSLEGFTDNTTNPPALRVVDLATKTVCEKIDLYGLNLKTEPEIVFVLDGKGYYSDVSGNIYRFEIK